jgi:hypothetical protein
MIYKYAVPLALSDEGKKFNVKAERRQEFLSEPLRLCGFCVKKFSWERGLQPASTCE